MKHFIVGLSAVFLTGAVPAEIEKSEVKQPTVLADDFMNLIAEGTPPEEADRSLLNLNKAKEYRIVKRMDASLIRARYVLNISSPEAKTFEERAQTTLKAAMDVQKQTGANVVAARLFIYELYEVLSLAVARAEYSGDGRDWSGSGKLRNGNWEVLASSIQVTDQQRELVRIWKDNYHRFEIDDGYGGTKTDEKELRKLIAKQLEMTETEVLMVLHELIAEGAQSKFWPEN